MLLPLDSPAVRRWIEGWHSGRWLEKFNPDQPRVLGGPHSGEWGSGGVAHGLKDALKLGEKADLKPGEHLIGSDKVSAESGTIRMALVDHHGTKSLRLGIGGYDFGGRSDEGGPWRAGPDRTAEINAERKKLSDEQESLGAEWNRLTADPHADPVRKAAVERRLDELDDTDTADVYAGGYTASLDPSAATQLQDAITRHLAAATKVGDSANAHYDEIDRLKAEYNALYANPNNPAWETDEGAKAIHDQAREITDRINALKATGLDLSAGGRHGDVYSAEGFVPGEWADVHYAVALDDLSVGVQVTLAAVPHGGTFDDLTGNEQAATLDPAEAKKFLKLLGRYTTASPPSAAEALFGYSPALERFLEGWDPEKHPRGPGGKFSSVADRIGAALKKPHAETKLATKDLQAEGERTANQVLDGAAGRIATKWKVSDSDLESLIREEHLWDHYKDKTPEDRKRAYAESLLRGWNGSSGGPVPVAAITGVLDHLGIDYKLSDREQRTNEFIRAKPEMRRAAESFGRAVYDATQAWFKERGITHVSAVRGTARGADWDNQRPFSSWAFHHGGIRNEGDRTIREETIPVDRIFSIPPTGFGSLDESELVVMPLTDAAHAKEAAGHDVTPGHDELHHYWTVGKGLSEWVNSPKPWTTLVALLIPHVGKRKAEIFASRWFIEVKGYAAGSDLNRVAHGQPPRGHVVGPG